MEGKNNGQIVEELLTECAGKLSEAMKILIKDDTLKSLTILMASNKPHGVDTLNMMRTLSNWIVHARILGDEYDNISGKSTAEQQLYFMKRAFEEIKLAEKDKKPDNDSFVRGSAKEHK